TFGGDEQCDLRGAELNPSGCRPPRAGFGRRGRRRCFPLGANAGFQTTTETLQPHDIADGSLGEQFDEMTYVSRLGHSTFKKGPGFGAACHFRLRSTNPRRFTRPALTGKNFDKPNRRPRRKASSTSRLSARMTPTTLHQ